MLAAAAANAGIADLLDAVLSVEEVKVSQAASFRLPASVRAPQSSNGKSLLCVLEWLGCLLRQVLWLWPPVVQTFRVMSGGIPETPGRGDRYARRAARPRFGLNVLG